MIRWDQRYLGDVINKMNFRPMWRKWILECVTTSTTFVLANGSPTKEFKKERGLHQGDHLSPIILAAEGLKVMMNALVEAGLFTDFGVGVHDNVSVSHLHFANDTLVVGVK